ncbi:hypothetical protein TWF281_004186 [Arthrobotrys megalospora]
MLTFDTIPTELQNHILSFIPPWELSNPRQVCRKWNELISQLSKINFPVVQNKGVPVPVHWLLYNNYHCAPTCPTCFHKYETDKDHYPTLSSATFKRVFLVANLDEFWGSVCGHEIWIEKCSSSPAQSSRPDGDDFRKIKITRNCGYDLLKQTVLRPRAQDADYSHQPNRIDPTFSVRYLICFPHCSTDFTNNPVSARNPPSLSISRYMSLLHMMDSTWVPLKQLCYKFARQNVKVAQRVRFLITGVGNRPVIQLELDAEGVCCSEIEAKQGLIQSGVFTRR